MADISHAKQEVSTTTPLNRFCSALVAKDKAAALRHMIVSGKVNYEPVLDKLIDKQPQIVGTLSPPATFSQSETMGEYVVRRAINDAT